VFDGDSMTCLSPHITSATHDDVVVNVSFKMDDVNLIQSSFQLGYVQAPSIFPANTSCTALPGNLFTFLLRIQVELCKFIFLTYYSSFHLCFCLCSRIAFYDNLYSPTSIRTGSNEISTK